MTRLWTDGAEFGDILGLDAASAATSASTSYKRSGSYSYATTYGPMLKTLASSASEVFCRFAVFTPGVLSTTAFFVLRSGATVIGSLGRNSNGFVEIRVGSTYKAAGTIPLQVGVWYVIEWHLKINDSVGISEIKIDGVADATFSGDTKPGAETTVNTMVMYGTGTGNNTAYFDDLALNNTAGAEDNSWCGDGSVILLKPNANGDVSDLTGSDGNQVDNYLMVDEIPADSDTTYSVGSTAGQRDLYGITDFSGAGKTINRVWVEARARDTIAAGGECYLSVKVSGGIEQKSNAITLLTTYTKQLLGTVHTVNPETLAGWSNADLNAIQIGFEVK